MEEGRRPRYWLWALLALPAAGLLAFGEYRASPDNCVVRRCGRLAAGTAGPGDFGSVVVGGVVLLGAAALVGWVGQHWCEHVRHWAARPNPDLAADYDDDPPDA
jgi:hypothetical protein